MFKLLIFLINSFALAAAPDCETVLLSPSDFVRQTLRAQSTEANRLGAGTFLARLYQAGSDRKALETLSVDLLNAHKKNHTLLIELRDVFADLIMTTHQAGFDDLARSQVALMLKHLGHPLVSDVSGLIEVARRLAVAGIDIESYGIIDALENHLKAYFAYPTRTRIEDLERTHHLTFSKQAKKRLANFYKERAGQWISRIEIVNFLKTLVNEQQIITKIDLNEEFPRDHEFGKYRFLTQGVLDEAFLPEPLIAVVSGSARARLEKLVDYYTAFELEWALAQRKLDFDFIEQKGIPAPRGSSDFLAKALAVMQNPKFKRLDLAFQSQVKLLHVLKTFLPNRPEFVLAHLSEVYPSPSALELFELLAKSEKISWTEKKKKSFVDLWARYNAKASEYLLRRYQGAEPEDYNFITLTSRVSNGSQRENYREFHHYNWHEFLRASFMLKHLPSRRHEVEQIVQSFPESEVFENPHSEFDSISASWVYHINFHQAAFKVFRLIDLAQQEPQQALHWLTEAERIAGSPMIRKYDEGGLHVRLSMIEAWGRTRYVGNARSLLLKMQREEPEAYQRYKFYIDTKLKAVIAAHLAETAGIQLARELQSEFERGAFSAWDIVSAARELWVVPALQDVAVAGMRRAALQYGDDPDFEIERLEVIHFVLDSPLSSQQKQTILLDFIPHLLKPEENSPKELYRVLARQEKTVATLLHTPEFPLVRAAMREYLTHFLESLRTVENSADGWTRRTLEILRHW